MWEFLTVVVLVVKNVFSTRSKYMKIKNYLINTQIHILDMLYKEYFSLT